MWFTEAELQYLRNHFLGRLATIGPDGFPQNNPVGFFLNLDLATVDIGGSSLGTTRRFKNVLNRPEVSLVVDDIKSRKPWHVRGVEIRGRAQALSDVEPPAAGYSRELIRIYPTRIRSWGLD